MWGVTWVRKSLAGPLGKLRPGQTPERKCETPAGMIRACSAGDWIGRVPPRTRRSGTRTRTRGRPRGRRNPSRSADPVRDAGMGRCTQPRTRRRGRQLNASGACAPGRGSVAVRRNRARAVPCRCPQGGWRRFSAAACGAHTCCTGGSGHARRQQRRSATTRLAERNSPRLPLQSRGSGAGAQSNSPVRSSSATSGSPPRVTSIGTPFCSSTARSSLSGST